MVQPLHEGFIKESKNGIIYSPRANVKPINPPPKMKADKVKEPLCYNSDCKFHKLQVLSTDNPVLVQEPFLSRSKEKIYSVYEVSRVEIVATEAHRYCSECASIKLGRVVYKGSYDLQ